MEYLINFDIFQNVVFLNVTDFFYFYDHYVNYTEIEQTYEYYKVQCDTANKNCYR